MEKLQAPKSASSFQTKKYNRPARKNLYEKAAWQVQNVVCGIDEVGRGCLAGPLVAAAVILPIGKIHPLIKDSKLMDLEERIKAYTWIIKHCNYGIGIVHHRIIDRHNIWQANLIAMQKAVMHLTASTNLHPSAILVDAVPLKLQSPTLAQIPVYHFPKGESLSSSIAAASIVAKVWRDNLIIRMADSFPGYSLAEHKGYATSKHTQSILNQPISIIHRISFLKWHAAALAEKENNEANQQQRLC